MRKTTRGQKSLERERARLGGRKRKENWKQVNEMWRTGMAMG